MGFLFRKLIPFVRFLPLKCVKILWPEQLLACGVMLSSSCRNNYSYRHEVKLHERQNYG